MTHSLLLFTKSRPSSFPPFLSLSLSFFCRSLTFLRRRLLQLLLLSLTSLGLLATPFPTYYYVFASCTLSYAHRRAGSTLRPLIFLRHTLLTLFSSFSYRFVSLRTYFICGSLIPLFIPSHTQTHAHRPSLSRYRWLALGGRRRRVESMRALLSGEEWRLRSADWLM